MIAHKGQDCSKNCFGPLRTWSLDHLRKFVKTHVILAPLRVFSRSRAASKIPFPGAKAGKFGEPDFFSF